jgi:8-amino-7-oxononanoate synthase
MDLWGEKTKNLFCRVKSTSFLMAGYNKDMDSIRMQGPVGARTVFNGREFDYFSGTGYLGLQTHPQVIQAAVEAVQRYGLSTASSRGGFGEHPLYDELEQAACAYFGAEKVLYFASGYLGIAILTQAANDQFDHIFLDSAAHFSLWDAAKATNKPITVFHHCRVDRLAEALRCELLPDERPLVLSDGVFPISGEIAPLPGYLELVRIYHGLVYLDDAHAVGVLGPEGRGTPDFYGIQDELCRTSGTLAKALGGYGGVIWGKADWVDRIDQNSAVCVGASPPPLVVAAASARALEIAHRSPQLRQSLWANVAQARAGLRSLGWKLEDTPAPILCLEGRAGLSLERIKTGLYEQGIAVTLVRGYTSTPPGGALRIAIFATHTPEQIDRLVGAIGGLI